MSIYTFLYVIIAVALIFSYLNYRYIKMQPTIAMMAASLVISALVILSGWIGHNQFEQLLIADIQKINFNFLLMNVMLSFLLFAGSLAIDFQQMKSQRWEITSLAAFTTIASTFLIATAVYYLLQVMGISLDYIYCLLFGSLISPTDPIAVLAIFKKVGAPKSLETTLAGESLFNDGVGIVLFITVFSVAYGHTAVTPSAVLLLFIKESIGGLLYGLIIGLIANRLLRAIDDHKIAIFLTIAITTGCYAIAQDIGISGPLAMVAAGICVGNCQFKSSHAEQIKRRLNNFWEVIDELLNVILFLFIGFEILLISYHHFVTLAALITIPIVLAIRYLTVAIPIGLCKLKKTYPKNTITILTWGGLRGGLAVALALAIPNGRAHDIILPLTFAVVIFSILVQGLSVKKLINSM